MFLIDLLFPKFCLGCGYVGVYLCQSCQNKLKPIESDTCLYCKKPSLFGLTHPNCINKLYVDGLVTIYHYNPILKKIIKNIKYRLAVQVWEDFYKIIEPQVITKLGFYKKLSSDFVIQPIPLSQIKYNERGFNQAKIISNFFQKFLHFPIVDLLVRKKEVSSQAQIKSKRARYLNTRGAFVINDKCRDVINHVSTTNIILIDDVITSGSTVKEAVKVLKRAGVKKVYVLALAKG
ncbi:MAG: double zinc ribbon domain-containing protein [Patescibacteria group bacterium]